MICACAVDRRVQQPAPAAVAGSSKCPARARPAAARLNGVMRAARSACDTWVNCASENEVTEMPIAAPMLRNRLSSAAPSPRSSRRQRGEGQHRQRIEDEAHAEALHHDGGDQPLLGDVRASTGSCRRATRTAAAGPTPISLRWSMRVPMRPASIIATMVPMPRGAIARPGGLDRIVGQVLQVRRQQGGTGQQHHADREHHQPCRRRSCGRGTSPAAGTASPR